MVCPSVGNITNTCSRPYAGSLHMLIYVVLKTTQQARLYDVQFSDKETGSMTCPGVWQNQCSSTFAPRPNQFQFAGIIIGFSSECTEVIGAVCVGTWDSM